MAEQTHPYSYGTALDKIRKERGLTQQQMADLCGISQSYLSEILNANKVPDITLLQQICSKLETPFAKLVLDSIDLDQLASEEVRELVSTMRPAVNRIYQFRATSKRR